MKSLIENLQALGTKRLIILGGVGAAIVAAIVGMSLIMSRASMTALYANLDKGESARIGQVLQELNIPFDIQNDGTAVLVAPDDARRARMSLAERGLPASGSAGYKLFDDAGALGLTSFMQQVTRTRALEGELARTIQTMDGVVAARVHLVLPEREAFSRTAARPTASVFIRANGAASVAREKALAIQRLVASAVPNLKPDDVTVLDASGAVLAAQGENNPLALRGMDLKRETEAKMAETVSQLLGPYLGQGSFRVAVTTQLNTDREVVAEETYDPDSRVERSRRNLNETESSNDTSIDPPTTVSQNLPAQPVSNEPGTKSNSSTQKTEETINYEISSIRRERTIEGGRIERINVAVLVDGVHAPGPDGKSTYTPRSAEELEKIATIVRTATGFVESRGDVVTVENVRFQDHGMEITAMGEPGLPEVLLRNMGTIVQSVVLLIIVGLLVAFGLRPLLARLLENKGERRKSDGGLLADLTREGEGAPSLARPEPAEVLGTATQSPGEPRALPDVSDTDRFMESMIQLKSVEGRVRESSIAKLSDIVEQHPDEAIGILRAWIYEGAQA